MGINSQLSPVVQDKAIVDQAKDIIVTIGLIYYLAPKMARVKAIKSYCKAMSDIALDVPLKMLLQSIYSEQNGKKVLLCASRLTEQP